MFQLYASENNFIRNGNSQRGLNKLPSNFTNYHQPKTNKRTKEMIAGNLINSWDDCSYIPAPAVQSSSSAMLASI